MRVPRTASGIPPAVPLLRSCEIQPFVRWLEGVSVPTVGALRRAGLPSEPMERPHALVAEALVWQFVEDAARLDGIPDLGWRVGAATPAALLDAFARISSARSLREGILALCHEERWTSPAADFGLQEEGGEAWFWRRPTPGIDVGRDLIEQYVAAMMVQFVRVAAGPGWAPARLRLQMQRLHPTAREVLCDADVELGAPVTAIHLAPQLLSLSWPKAAGGAPSPAREERAPDPASDLVGGLRQALPAALPLGTPDAEWGARAARMSRRTFHRRLGEEGVRWGELLAAVRREVACRELGHTDIPIQEVARKVGYSDPANFTRAFRRWTGSTPQAYRDQMRRGFSVARCG